ncbi:helix-turn-helix domain-containing protein [Flavivirga spongiicola]|uniref:XRE family transcriptional regulator n=1 Tax=Flavivirga spongiicola TaxID=421621 RepID=A0ABU7XPL4_9FLAO|nr:XRE family transcriptional regulator [Flavivirga sp. MEBiC05379]MDO5977461.1 XRE family transcriptional regulator [Flavivirga sp. MEBiC05379]
MEDILVNLGKQLKKIRVNKSLSLKQVAEMSDVSIGLISKIENFRTTPSLPVLLKIMQSLQIDLSELNLSSNNKESYILIKKGEGEIEEREDSRGLEYTFLFSDGISESNLRTYIVKVNKDVYREPISTDATELIYVIQGSINYILNDELLILGEGDVLFFDGSIPHAVQNKYSTTAVMLKMYFIKKTPY